MHLVCNPSPPTTHPLKWAGCSTIIISQLPNVKRSGPSEINAHLAVAH